MTERCPTCEQPVSKERFEEICAIAASRADAAADRAEAAARRIEAAAASANYRGDAAVPNQLNFQTPATAIMEKIVDLHHDLMFFIIAIVVFVS